MKILYVITGADIGGAQRHVLYLAEWFSRKGAVVEVVVGEDGPLVDELTCRGIKTVIIPIQRKILLKQDLKALWELSTYIKKGRFDIVHSHSSKAGIIARLAGFFTRTEKNIFTAHGFVFTDPTLSKKKRLFYCFLEKVCSWLATDIITVSAFDYQHGAANGISMKKLTSIHNGIPSCSILSYQQWHQKQEGLRKREKRIIGYVGRFAAEKNLDMLFRVAEQLRSQENIEFWLIGDGPLFEHYQAKCQHLPIVLKGNQENIPAWMDQMDVLLITSHKEGLPFVLLEACSRGLPVISTNVGGIQEVVGTEDVLVSINDVKAMTDKLTELLFDGVTRREIGQCLLERARLFTVEQMCSETNKVYFRRREKNAIYHQHQPD